MGGGFTLRSGNRLLQTLNFILFFSCQYQKYNEVVEDEKKKREELRRQEEQRIREKTAATKVKMTGLSKAFLRASPRLHAWRLSL